MRKNQRLKNERGAGMIEYAILVGLIAIIGIVGVRLTGIEAKRELCVGALSFSYSSIGTPIDFRARTARGLPTSTGLYDYTTGRCYSTSTFMPALRGFRIF